ncbi:glycosyltransferase family 2 protein [Flavobacterium agricola]|uniref:N-acetylglucosaminyltransferase n=1 Tax=Flavobacterium agricola TaxID=2870839 RepID=A0ABY6M204_9FLAO|nr:glycosyltransferase [Flavobacterium agricola]UYW01146.1 glycosyltransferase family 2 protein [Flavobacterium agricola]
MAPTSKKSKFQNSYFVALLALVLIAGAFILANQLENKYHVVYLFTQNNLFLKTIAILGTILLASNLLLLSYFTYLYYTYKPINAVSDASLPTCSVIIPAYNEGKLVYETLQSVVQTNYPFEKLEIIVVDDGSTDDTWQWIYKAHQDFKAPIVKHQLTKNSGKRQALYEAFKMGKGDVFITIDSDSIIEPETLRLLTSPFVTQQNCGAVAGNVKIRNAQHALLPKMLNVRFIFSFEFIRAAQSRLGFVLSTPGALSAYKREAIESLLEPWITQTFLGKISDIGEDRALTTMVFKNGWNVLFQKEARVFTNIPTGYKQLYKMFLRWERSNVRELLYMGKFIFTDFRKGNKIAERIIYLEQCMQLLFAIPFVLAWLLLLVNFPVLTIITTVVGCFFSTSEKVSFYAFNYKSTEAIWAYSYSIFFVFTLFWVVPYSIITVKKGGWLTK